MVFVNYIYDIGVDTQFHKFYARPFARVVVLLHALSSCRIIVPFRISIAPHFFHNYAASS